MPLHHRKAWSDYWAADTRPGGTACLPDEFAALDQVRKNVWREFARDLPRRAKILDLATGDGCVMGWIVGRRPDVKAIGIDFAPVLPSPPRGTMVKASASMEDIPAADATYNAVTSQFGFEYGDTYRVAHEAARVSKPDGRLALMTHRIDGPILAHNLRRREAIVWAIEERELIGLASRSLALRGAGISAIPATIDRAPAEGARRYGPKSAAWEIAEAIRRTLVLGRRDTAMNVAGILSAIGTKARNEIARIDALQEACVTTAHPERFDQIICSVGFHPVSVRALSIEASDTPFADFREYRRRK